MKWRKIMCGLKGVDKERNKYDSESLKVMLIHT